MTDAPHQDPPGPTTARFSPEDVRILGCLIEKSRTTPDDYPLTANALMRAANQTTSRDPVVDYDVGLVERTAADLKARGFVRFVHTPSGRATTRYRHVVDEHLGLDAAETAVLGLLMLRGAQTLSELKTRSERWHSFASPDDVAEVLGRLARRDDPLVVLLERQVGQKEVRWTHLLYGEPLLPDPSSASGGAGGGGAAARIAELEARVEELAASLAEVRGALGMD